MPVDCVNPRSIKVRAENISGSFLLGAGSNAVMGRKRPENYYGSEERLEVRVSAANLENHTRRLASDIGERNVFRAHALAEAAAYIEDTWSHQGYLAQRQSYEVRGVQCANLEVTRPGTDPDAGILLLGAHYDSVKGSPGANDNASGVAALLEMSRLFADRTPSMTVRFVAFVNEEPPFFRSRRQGSLVYAKAARAASDDIRLMVALETIGYYRNTPGSQRYPPLFRLFYPNRGDFIGFVSNFSSRQLMRQAVRCFREVSDFPLEHLATFGSVPGVSWSDHRAFWRSGYRAIMVTDTAFYRYPYYHTANDTPDKLAYPEFARVTEGLFGCFAEIARAGIQNRPRRLGRAQPGPNLYARSPGSRLNRLPAEKELRR